MKRSTKRKLAALANPFLSRYRPGNIAMFHLGRSGSTVLGNLLDQHTRISWAKELYTPYLIKYDEIQLPVDRSEPIFPVDPETILKKDMVIALHRYYGVEFKLFHFKFTNYDYTTFLSKLDMLGFNRFIVLKRSNLLRVIISKLIAKSNNMYYHLKMDQHAKLHQIKINPESLFLDHQTRSLIEVLEDYDNQMDLITTELETRMVLHLSYEADIQNDPLIAYQKVCTFLDLHPHLPRIKIKRTNPFPLSELITNFDEIKELLGKTKFGWMIKE